LAPSTALGGLTLHSGVPASVLFAPHQGPVVLEHAGRRCTIQELTVVRADSGVKVRAPDDGFQVDLIEHVLAALGGLALTAGVRIVVDGPEPPLLDGGASTFVRALQRLALRPQSRCRRITRALRLDVGRSSYELEPSDRTSIEVSVEFAHPRVAVATARWNGTARDFEERIAPARTFGFFEDWSTLKEQGRARGANIRDVVVLCRDGTSLSDPPPAPDECARHKLLDLVGDLTLSGGVPQGLLRVTRPGHSANLEAFARCQAMGALGPA
jgi:UDP-3-O-[3-hydroxymyristoyl] N-acetylglucosamine deacetylase